jgi:hypothetical protein
VERSQDEPCDSSRTRGLRERPTSTASTFPTTRCSPKIKHCREYSYMYVWHFALSKVTLN